MIQPLLKLLGAHGTAALTIADWSLEFRGPPAGSIWLIGLALAGLTIWLYRRSPVAVRPGPQAALIGLRILFFLFLLTLIRQPVLRLGIEGRVRRSFMIVLDGTASMRSQDPRDTDADRKRVALAKGWLNARGGLDQPLSQPHELTGIARAELLQAVLENPQLDLLRKLRADFDLVFYAFGKELTAFPGDWRSQYQPDRSATALGDAVRELLRRQRGQAVAGALLITDGGNNSGSAPRDAARLAQQEKCPLYIYGIGLTAPKDISVESLFTEDVAFVKAELTVAVRVRGQGLAGEKATVILKFDTQPVAAQEIIFTDATDQIIEMKFTPQRTGTFDLQAAIAPRADETSPDNNCQSKHVRVIDTKINVLLIEQAPRWEFRYLLTMLRRDPRLNVNCLLFEADPSVAQTPDSPYLPEFPQPRAALYKYDVILLGDVDPQLLAGGQLEMLRDYVSQFGGALVLLAGKQFNPAAYTTTPLRAAFPVEIRTEPAATEVAADQPIPLKLTASGRENPMLALADQAEASGQIWQGLPPVDWVAPVAGIKPAASVLLTAPDSHPGGRDQRPVLVLQKYGLGQALFMGTDSTWRWRKNAGDKYFTLLWSQIVQRLATARLLGAAKRTQLSSDRQSYHSGDRVTVEARLYTPNFEPVNAAQVTGGYAPRDRQPTAPGEQAVTLRPLPGQPGLYRGELIAPQPGAYRFSVESDPETELAFAVQPPQFELGQTALNEPLLREMAAASGGAFLREEDLYRLPELVDKKVMTVRSDQEIEVWSSPLVFLWCVLVTGLEWALRKKFQLK